MGLNPLWEEDFFLTIQGFHQHVKILGVKPHFIIDAGKNFFIHLVPLNNNFTPHNLIQLQLAYSQQNKMLVHLWEDVWCSKREQVVNRIYSFLGLNQSVHGRKAEVTVLNEERAAQFLNAYHLQGYVKAKVHHALSLDNIVVAVASFSDIRIMKNKAQNYTSSELVRFASKTGFTVVGGLSKLIKNYLANHQLNDLMSYADRDWSVGKGYQRLGFHLSAETDPLVMYLNRGTLLRYAAHRLPKKLLADFNSQSALKFDDFLLENNYIKIFNTGNLKYHSYL